MTALPSNINAAIPRKKGNYEKSHIFMLLPPPSKLILLITFMLSEIMKPSAVRIDAIATPETYETCFMVWRREMGMRIRMER